MREIKEVAVLVETASAYGRGLLCGLSRFHHENKSWSIAFRQRDVRTPLPSWFDSWSGDGILSRLHNRVTAKKLLKKGVPIIDLQGVFQALDIPVFGVDNRLVAEMGYTYLKSRGLTNFAFVGKRPGVHKYNDERREAFFEIIKQDGNGCRIYPYKDPVAGVKNWERGSQKLIDWIAECPKPIGILCCHDDQGQQVLDACLRAEVGVPNEVAVLGVDNDNYACGLSIPSLSSIDLNPERIGYEAAILLDNLMRGKCDFKEPCLFPPLGVVERQSTDVVACDDPKIAEAMLFIRHNACLQLTVSAVERKVGLSRSAFNRRFNRVLGHSPIKEITRIQIEHAKTLIVSSDLPIYEISDKCGFSESKYFISVFRKHTGLTPQRYRMKHGRHRMDIH